MKSVEEIKELQASVTVLEEKAKHRSEAEWKKLESQQKVYEPLILLFIKNASIKNYCTVHHKLFCQFDVEIRTPLPCIHFLLLQELQDKCTSQNSTIRSLEKTLQMKTSELSDMMERL